MKLIFTLLFTLILSTNLFSQISIIQFNAGWNAANSVEWTKQLTDCKVSNIDIGTNKEAQTKYKIASIPTIIIFKDGEEVKRFQADLSFKMVATKEEVQSEIDEQLMSDF